MHEISAPGGPLSPLVLSGWLVALIGMLTVALRMAFEGPWFSCFTWASLVFTAALFITTRGDILEGRHV